MAGFLGDFSSLFLLVVSWIVFTQTPTFASSLSSPSATSLLFDWTSSSPPPLHPSFQNQFQVRAPRVRGLRGDFRVESKGRLKLRCKVSGNPFPQIEWFRNGKKLRNKGRISIRNRRKLSLLEIAKANPAIDTGYYECRASNEVSPEPAIGRIRVIVTRPSRRPSTKPRVTTTPSSIASHQSSRTSTEPPTSSTTTVTSIASSVSSTTTRKSGVDRSSSGTSHEWVRSCPINDFCLNGGVCSFYESIGEYVCQCAEGYKGMRCEMKDLIAVYASR